MICNSKVTFWTLGDGYLAVGNACLNDTGLPFSLPFTRAGSPKAYFVDAVQITARQNILESNLTKSHLHST